MVARNVPVAGVELAGVTLNPLSVARNLPPDSSSALALVTKAHMQRAKIAATAKYFGIFMLMSALHFERSGLSATAQTFGALNITINDKPPITAALVEG
jgi:hypothetical protein